MIMTFVFVVVFLGCFLVFDENTRAIGILCIIMTVVSILSTLAQNAILS